MSKKLLQKDKGIFVKGYCMNRKIKGVVEINEKPEFYQVNYSPVNPNLEGVIYKGKKCTMDESLYNAFRKCTQKTGKSYDVFALIFKILAVWILIMIFVPVLGMIVMMIQMVQHPEDSAPAMLLIPVTIIIGTILAGVLLLKASSKISEHGKAYEAAISSVRPWLSECYMYKKRLIMRYRYDTGDHIDYKYYINLQDFLVEILNFSEDWCSVEYVYAIIIKQKGKDTFFLFHTDE
ncbi:MAG: hypothetical protein ACI4DK_01275 [Lachnospiraceae bacterium]